MTHNRHLSFEGPVVRTPSIEVVDRLRAVHSAPQAGVEPAGVDRAPGTPARDRHAVRGRDLILVGAQLARRAVQS